MYKLLKSEKLEACAAYSLSDSSDSDYEFEPLYSNITDYVKNTDWTFTEFVNNLQVYFNKDVCQKIFDATKQQSCSEVWFYQRTGRITGSIVHSCLHFTGRHEDGSLIKSIMGQNQYDTTFVAALNHGKRFEEKARQLYVKTMDSHGNFSSEMAGFMIYSSIPFIGASPDGFVNCQCCGQGLVEIKCPYKYADQPATIAAKLDKKNFHIDDGQVKLKTDKSSPYYCQIQCQLGVTQRKWCDLVIYTHVDIFVTRIDFNNVFWSETTDKLVTFYKQYIIKKLKI